MMMTEYRPRRLRRFLTASGFQLAILVAFVAGTAYGGVTLNRLSTSEVLDRIVSGAGSLVDDDSVDFNTYYDVWTAIGQRYVGENVSEKNLLYGSIAGMVASLGDPYSVFLNPDEATTFDQEIEGTFEGIGAEIGYKNGVLVVISPLPDTPAEGAGLKSNDRILAIDGTDTTGLTVDQAVQLIRGELGTTVILTIQSDGIDSIRDVIITRGTISVDSVTLDIRDDTIAVMTISRFGPDTLSLFDSAVQELLVSNATGLVVDLRGNPGGYLDVAVDIGTEFVGDRTIVQERFRNGDAQPYSGTRSSARLQSIPIVVLVDGGSASAAEILAGAVQDYDRGTLIGTQTFGKGSVQDLQDFDDGSVLKLTVAEWLTPDGRSITGTGIVPDTVVEISDDQYTQGEDPQLDAAVEVLLQP